MPEMYENLVVCFLPPTDSHDHPAKHLSEGPVHECQLQGDKWQAHHAEDIGHRQVQDVDVGHRLHFGITEDDIYDQGVAAQPHGTDHEINEGDDHGAGFILVQPVVVGEVEVGVIALHKALVKGELGDGDVGRRREKRPLI